MKKKLLPMLLIVVIVLNFILCNCVYADDAKRENDNYGGNSTLSGTAAQEVTETGKDSSGNEFKEDNSGGGFIGLIMQSIALVINSFPMCIHGMMSIISYTPPTGGNILSNTLGLLEATVDPDAQFTIERTVFNELSLFNINVFNTEPTYTIGLDTNSKTIPNSETAILLKNNTANWFYICRLIAMMINLCILIYVGIRMALSTIASEEAKYKKMLMSWLESMVILFFLHYIMLFLLSIGDIVLNIENSIRISMINAGKVGFERIILDEVYFKIGDTSGIQVFMYSLFYWFLIFLHVKFFLSYIKRMLAVMFLTIIAPFITVTYPIDKMGDGKAQAFQGWMEEYLVNIVLQPIHAGVYIVFVFTAGEIAQKAPFIAMIFLLTLGRTEKIVRTLFGMNKSVSVKNLDDQTKENKKKKG